MFLIRKDDTETKIFPAAFRGTPRPKSAQRALNLFSTIYNEEKRKIVWIIYFWA